uniref:Neuropeptide S n=1 Tax=Falco tinnunculus TaxID=100819 RepID=A0A8C4XSH0_FALTI
MISLCRLNFVFILWISMILLCSSYPVVPSTLYGKSDYCLVLLNNCLAKVGRNEELAFLKPYLEMPFNKRSFRNGVGSGIKKTSFRRAKS